MWLTQMNLHATIRSEYGQDSVELLRDLENTARKIARFKNHLRFNLHCKHHHVTPTSLKLSSTVQGIAAKNILRKAERSLIGVRIGQTSRKIKQLTARKEKLNAEVIENLPDHRPEVTEFIEQAQLREHNVCKTRQIEKFRKLQSNLKRKEVNNGQVGNSIATECMSRWVTNSSKRILNDPELSVLQKGLNFAVTPKHVPVVDIITITEGACRSLNSGQSDELRAKILNVLDKHDVIQDHNITKEEVKALESLRKDTSIKILPADKGRTTVVLDTDEYIRKCNLLLSDTKTYKKVNRDPTQNYKKEFAKVLKDLLDRQVIDRTLHKKLYPTSDQPPKFYELPKIHKKDTPLRPIVSSVGSISYNCARYIADILSPIVGNTPYHVKNSKEFVDKINHYRVEPDEELRSFDVSALFTSVPVDNALIIIQSRLENDTTLKDRTNFNTQRHYNVTRFMPEVHLFCFPRGILHSNPWGRHGVSCFSYCLQYLHGGCGT